MWDLNWIESFKDQPTCEEILIEVKKNKRLYWSGVSVSIFFVIIGTVGIMINRPGETKALVEGLLSALTGIIFFVYSRLSVQIRMSMYFTIWDSIRRTEAEIRKSEAADL